MSVPIVIRPTEPLTIVIGKAQTVNPPLVVHKPTGSGSDMTTIEAWWDIPQALGMEVITAEDINQAVSSIWHDIFDRDIILFCRVPAETIAVIPLKTNDEPLEVLWDIPQELTITNIPSQDINQAVATLWQATFE